MMKIGIIKENKIPIDNRTPFSPSQALLIKKKGTLLKYQNTKFNLKSISQKRDFGILLNDISFYQFYKNYRVSIKVNHIF